MCGKQRVVWVQWTWVLLTVSAVGGYDITDEQYYEMPRLFLLDNYDECMARRGTFCLGSFDLLAHTNHKLLGDIQKFSEDKYHFNHSSIHRGLCISSRCADVRGSSARSRFEQCVGNLTVAQYGLEANLTRLEYCRTGGQRARPVDRVDTAFACVCGVILLMNVVGTAYDVFTNSDTKRHKYLSAWSVRASWRRLTADHSQGEARLAALRPVQGMKVLTLVLIMLAHSVLAYHLTYIYNPLFFEKASHHPISAYFQNGTSIVQTFIMVSSFLLAYNLLLHAENSKQPLSLAMLPKALLHRITRITPVYLFMIGLTVTWWRHASDGPLWQPLVGDECARCRDKWWTHALFIHNLVQPDPKCLLHTWFLAVDMQLYVVSAALTLALGRRPRLALKILPVLFAASVATNFTIAYYFKLKPMVTLMFPEYMRTLFEDEPSFTWLYQAPWDSLPAALLGIFVAFLHHQLQTDGYKPADSLWVRVAYRASVPCMFLWVFLGYLMKGAALRAGVALYAALDRPAFAALTALAMYGFFNKIDSAWWRFLSWRGWEVLGRMSLSVYLVHWMCAVTQLALRPHLSPLSVHEIGGHFLWTVFTSYCVAVPLHLLIELPMQKFLQSIF